MSADGRGDRPLEAPARGGAFYDLPDVFERYRDRRPGLSNPNFVMEEPALLEELGCVRGLRVLDLGCGDAALGRTLLDAGCERYLGIDASLKMVGAAQETLRGTTGEVLHADMEEFLVPPAAFDLVVSRVALHYVEKLETVLEACGAGLSRGGRMIVTVLHPVITSHDARPSGRQLRTNWVVDDYFVTGPREQQWLGEKVLWHHRTIEQYVAGLHRSGLTLTGLRECAPRRERFDDDTEFARRARIPMFLLFAAARL